MKLRYCFVSNSSTANFILPIDANETKGEDLSITIKIPIKSLGAYIQNKTQLETYKDHMEIDLYEKAEKQIEQNKHIIFGAINIHTYHLLDKNDNDIASVDIRDINYDVIFSKEY